MQQSQPRIGINLHTRLGHDHRRCQINHHARPTGAQRAKPQIGRIVSVQHCRTARAAPINLAKIQYNATRIIQREHAVRHSKAQIQIQYQAIAVIAQLALCHVDTGQRRKLLGNRWRRQHQTQGDQSKHQMRSFINACKRATPSAMSAVAWAYDRRSHL